MGDQKLTPNEIPRLRTTAADRKKNFLFCFFEAVLVEPKKPVPLSWLELLFSDSTARFPRDPDLWVTAWELAGIHMIIDGSTSLSSAIR
jgi:hypothetical protein